MCDGKERLNIQNKNSLPIGDEDQYLLEIIFRNNTQTNHLGKTLFICLFIFGIFMNLFYARYQTLAQINKRI